jgi:hypothetical protein
MTLSMSWVRKRGKTEELVTVSDSRTRFGCAWDCCPKVFPLSRGDGAIAFAGWTGYAYPLIQQALNTLNMHTMLVDRSLDFCDIQGHLLRIMNAMLKEVSDLPHGHAEAEPPDAEIILSGYSAKTSRFHIRKIHYSAIKKCFMCSRSTTLFRNGIIIAGDRDTNKQQDVVEVAKRFILEKLKKAGKQPGEGFDMEPFSVLVDMIRDGRYPTIGGAPQIVKTYKHMQSRPYSVFWPNGPSRKISFMGRPMLDYEISTFLILDPDTLETTQFKVVNPELRIKGHGRMQQDGANV